MKKKPLKKKFDWRKFWEKKREKEVLPPPTILLSLKSKQYQIEVHS